MITQCVVTKSVYTFYVVSDVQIMMSLLKIISRSFQRVILAL